MKFNELFKKLKSEEKPEGSPLFTDNSPEGYFSKKELIDFMTDNLGVQNTHLQLAFEHMQRNGNLNRELRHVEEGGKGATWFAFKKGRVAKTCRITHFGNIKQLLDDYEADRIRVKETLEDLYNEALS